MLLSPRELEVLEAAAAGETLVETGRRLFVSPQTVHTHRRNLREKLDARNMSHAVAVGYQTGILRYY